MQYKSIWAAGNKSPFLNAQLNIEKYRTNVKHNGLSLNNNWPAEMMKMWEKS